MVSVWLTVKESQVSVYFVIGFVSCLKTSGGKRSNQRNPSSDTLIEFQTERQDRICLLL